jgi:hypothetical protein
MDLPKKRKRGRPKLSEAEKKARAKAREALKKEKKAEDNRRIEAKLKKQVPYILTPRGKCPVPLLSIDEDAVRVWVKNICDNNKDGNHTVQSITYWIRDFHSIFSEEYKTIVNHVENICLEMNVKDLSPKLKRIYASVKKEGRENAEI